MHEYPEHSAKALKNGAVRADIEAAIVLFLESVSPACYPAKYIYQEVIRLDVWCEYRQVQQICQELASAGKLVHATYRGAYWYSVHLADARNDASMY